MTTFDRAVSVETNKAVRPVSSNRLVGILLLLQFVAFLVTLVVLGNAINWPASLNDPASKMLPLLRAQSGAIQIGYTGYLISALLLIPIAFLLRSAWAGREAKLLGVATFIGATAGVLKMFGIARWLVLMPALADSYLDPTASATTHDTITVIYNAFNKYAGGIGETFGVMLFAGVWTALISIALLRSRQFPSWLGYFGLAAAATLLVGLVQIFGLELGPILTISGVVWQLWMIALGITMFRQPSLTPVEEYR